MNASTGQSADWPVQVSAISHWPADPRHTVFEPRKRHVLEQHSPFLHCAPAASLQVLASQQGSSHSCNSKPIKVILPGPSACNLRFGKGSDVCTHVCRWINACTRVCHRCRCMCGTDLWTSTVTYLVPFSDTIATLWGTNSIGRFIVETASTAKTIHCGPTAGAPHLWWDTSDRCHHTSTGGIIARAGGCSNGGISKCQVFASSLISTHNVCSIHM